VLSASKTAGSPAAQVPAPRTGFGPDRDGLGPDRDAATPDDAIPAGLDAVGAGFCLHGPDAALVAANDTAAELLRLGLGPVPPVPMPAPTPAVVDLSGAPIDPAEHPTVRALRSAAAVRGVVLGVHPGTPRARWVRLDAAVVGRDAAGNARRVATLLVDVTAQTERSRESAAAAERATRLMGPVADVICRLDDTGRFLDVTRSAATVLGHEPEDLFGRTLAGLVHVEGAAPLSRALAGARAAGHGHAVVRCRRRDGELHWMDIAVSRVDATAEHPPELHAVLRDIHESVLTQQAGRESERHYRLLADNAADVVCVLDPSGRFRYASPSVSARFGHRPDELTGTAVTRLVHPDDADRVEALLAGLRDQTGPAVAEAERFLTYRLGHGSGGWSWVETVWRPVLDAAGALAELHTTTRDVSDRVAGDLALAAAEESFRVAFDSAQHGMARLTTDGRLQRVNDALCAMAGRTREELEGRPLRMLTHPDDADPLADLQRLGEGGHELHRDQRLLRRDGTTAWVELTLTAVRDSAGTVRHLVAQLLDTTAERVLAEQLRGLQLHDPLTTAATADLLRDRLGAALADPRRTGVAVLRVDLDRFRRLAEDRGHVAADRVLVLTVQRLREVVRESDLVARLGGDDFAVLCAGVDHEHLERLAQRAARALTGSVGGIGPLSASIGVGTARPDDGVEDVLNRAEAALSVVKLSGGAGWAVD
jgi:PAS domain S-box-containing protein/diguanylate cyclase (GGDEF)-like protein